MLNPVEQSFETKYLAAPNIILVATDLTDSEELLPHAMAQAQASNAALRLVHAIPPYDTFVPEAGKVPYIDAGARARDAQAMLEQMAQRVIAQGIRCSVTVRLGEPVDVVAELVQETGAQRVIARTHGRTGVKRLLLGSTAREILNRIEVPVCTIGPHCMPPPKGGIRTIVHPTALEPDSFMSARLSIDLARFLGAELTVLHVVNQGSAIEPYLDPHYAFVKLTELMPTELGSTPTKVHTRVVPGEMTKEILRAAGEVHADLIVLGVHPASSGWTLRNDDSVYSVVIAASCPVLSIRTPVQKAKKVADAEHDACVIS